ncbi:hypothetical protein M9980_13415 [Sphingomonas donggukensis]|uniref:Uncharacterized protein n=1 Tax=Sphingomonas donggukensis TaxID=2949093 RepID=A0ABY4TSX2_9SPHN|nr:hypothetical protein [Sphingomonas donggukensis]URW75510.1 hypothetical protein M9980_13415 [Sphingomonas donggukensis]
MVLMVVHKYLKATGMPPTKFGRGVANDPRLVGDMARGRVPGPDMVARIKAFIAAHPEGRA